MIDLTLEAAKEAWEASDAQCGPSQTATFSTDPMANRYRPDLTLAELTIISDALATELDDAKDAVAAAAQEESAAKQDVVRADHRLAIASRWMDLAAERLKKVAALQETWRAFALDAEQNRGPS